MKNVETSNLVLLIKNNLEDAETPVVASAIVNSHLDVGRTAPHFENLKQLLDRCPYPRENEEDAELINRRVSYEELLWNVRASDRELQSRLRQMGALCKDDRWCSVDASYLGTLLEIIILASLENGWRKGKDGIWSIPVRQMCATLQEDGHDGRLVIHCLEQYGTSTTGTGADKGDFYVLNEADVCRYFGIKMLKESATWPLDQFLLEWQESVPEGLQPELAMLKGDGLISKHPLSIKYFPVDELADEPESRFRALFKERARWEWDDLEPYVHGLAAPGQSVEALLLKHARMSQGKPTDPITYSAR